MRMGRRWKEKFQDGKKFVPVRCPSFNPEPNIKCGIGIEDRIFRQSMIPPRMVFAEIGNDEPLLQAKPGGDFYR